jgi:hypothetical protein
MYIVGIDPGKSGASAHIRDGQLIKVQSFNGDINECRSITVHHIRNPIYFIEQVTASPQMGVVSAFTFGKWAEAVETTARLGSPDVHMVRPQVWQNAIGVFSGGDKQKLYLRAQHLFPNEYKAKMFNKATSDAVMISYYGWRYMVNQEE